MTHTISENVKQYILTSANTGNPAVYVGTYAKYNDGSLFGAWLDMTQFTDADDFFEVCAELHGDESDPEFMIQDYMGFPEYLYSESMDREEVEYLIEWAAMDEDDRDILANYIDATGDRSADLNTALDAYQGCYPDFEEFAEMTFFEFYEVPDNIRPYIDISAFARDLKMDYHISNNGHVFRAC